MPDHASTARRFLELHLHGRPDLADIIARHQADGDAARSALAGWAT
jgi:hypothetical protein